MALVYCCSLIGPIAYIVLLICKSLWIKASAKWLNVNINICNTVTLLQMGSLLTKLELCFSRWYRWIKDIELVEIWMTVSDGGVLSLWTDENRLITSRCSWLTLTDRLSTSCVTFSSWACRAWIESVCLWSWNTDIHTAQRNTETQKHTHTHTHTRSAVLMCVSVEVVMLFCSSHPSLCCFTWLFIDLFFQVFVTLKEDWATQQKKLMLIFTSSCLNRI